MNYICPYPFTPEQLSANKEMCRLMDLSSDKYWNDPPPLPHHIMQDVRAIVIWAMVLITICVVTYMIAECSKAIARTDIEVELTTQYAKMANAEAIKAEERTKQLMLEKLDVDPALRGSRSVKGAMQELSKQLRGE